MEKSARRLPDVHGVGVIRDITDRQKAQKAFMEERKLFYQLINAVPLPIFFIKREGHLIFSNDALRKFTGVDADDLEGVCLKELFGEDGQPQLDNQLSDLLCNPDKKWARREIELKSGDGKYRSVDIILSEFHKSDQTEPAVIGVFMDVTEQKLFTTQLIEARRHAEDMARKAEEASQAKGNTGIAR